MTNLYEVSKLGHVADGVAGRGSQQVGAVYFGIDKDVWTVRMLPPVELGGVVVLTVVRAHQDRCADASGFDRNPAPSGTIH